ncbi:IclR family transcriptional regulator [Jiangella gansuensis]|uniref:IclR family transcriptional regulator n=1 Tax=Jiangella gansuensis TaxID=281473 RepID=UPI0004BA558B|nr:IclR family transcriptional regulator [Jiangella gansuensis]
MSQSLDRGLRILDEIVAGRTTLTELSQALGVHKSTVLRLLTVLQQHHVVSRVGTSDYRLGHRLFDLAAFALESRDITASLHEPVRALATAAKSTAYAVVLDDGAGLVIDVADHTDRFAGLVQVGSTLPLHATAAGKVLLASMKPTELDGVLNRVASSTRGSSPLDRAALLGELEKLRVSGIAQAHGEHPTTGLTVAAPVRDARGEVVAALAVIGGPAEQTRIDPRALLAQLLAATSNASARLGWTGAVVE